MLSSQPCLEPVAGYKGKYLIAPTGQLWNASKEHWQQTSAAGDYLKVTLTLNSKKEQLTLHRLVATHFLPNPYNHPIVNHIDGNKQNNHISNLEWVSAEGNAQHALETDLRSGYLPNQVKREFLEKVLSNASTIQELAESIGRRPETLARMLRERAKKDGRYSEWEVWRKARRAEIAQKNLTEVNSNALTPDQIALLFERATQGERIIDLAAEVQRHPNTLGALLRKYRDTNNLTTDFRSKGSR